MIMYKLEGEPLPRKIFIRFYQKVGSYICSFVIKENGDLYCSTDINLSVCDNNRSILEITRVGERFD